MGEIEQFLTLMIDSRRQLMPNSVISDWAYSSWEAFVLDHGHVYVGSPLPADVPTGTVKECFSNAFHLAYGNRALTYVEGYGSTEFLPAVHHAWCIDHHGRVIDNTWTAPEARTYFGVPIPFDTVTAIVAHNGYYGIFESDYLRDHVILKTGVIA